MNKQLNDIDSLSRLEIHRQEIHRLSALLEKTPQWRPAAALAALAKKSVSLIDAIEERFYHPLVVTLIGPSGAGKSTILNALAGIQDLSETGFNRPTTRSVVLYGQNLADTSQLITALGESEVQVKSHPPAARLSHLLLVDTPDTDSTDLDRHRPILQKVIGLSDVLLCVFDSENPKRMDHADFLSLLVQRFSGESLIVLLNKCDRMDKTELIETILPDFRNYLSQAWGVPLQAILCISGRSHLPDPHWPPSAEPRHDFDEFLKLTNHIFGTLNSSGIAVNRRIENAGQIQSYVYQAFHRELGQDRPFLTAAHERMIEAESAATASALNALAAESAGAFAGLTILLYQRLAERWVGPVGWMVAVWGRLLIFGMGLAGLLRFGNPLQQAWGMVSSLRRFKESRSEMDAAKKGGRVSEALFKYENKLREFWPDIAEQLIRGRFESAARQKLLGESANPGLSERLEMLWEQALNRTLDKTADRLSHGFLQLLFNLPSMAVLAYVGWLTVREFFAGRILSSDFFLHGILTLSFVLFFSFFLFQAIVRMSVRHRSISKQMLLMIYAEMNPLSSGGVSLPFSPQVSILLSSDPTLEESPPPPDGNGPIEQRQTEQRSSEHH